MKIYHTESYDVWPASALHRANIYPWMSMAIVLLVSVILLTAATYGIFGSDEYARQTRSRAIVDAAKSVAKAKTKAPMGATKFRTAGNDWTTFVWKEQVYLFNLNTNAIIVTNIDLREYVRDLIMDDVAKVYGVEK